MPSANHTLVTIGGTFGSGGDAEIWQCGVKLLGKASDGTPIAGGLRDLTAYVNARSTAVSTWWANAANLLRSDFALTFLKAANIGAGSTANPYGKYTGLTDEAGGPNPAVFTYASPVAGGAAVASFPTPPIITVAATFRNSAAPRGPRHTASHGRVYLPFRLQTASNRIASPAGYVTAAAGLLTALKATAVSWNAGPVIGDQVVDVVPGLIGRDGAIRLINRVEVGDVVDTVRNRKSALREVYTGSAFS